VEKSLVTELRRLVLEDEAKMLGPIRQQLLAGVKTPERFDALKNLLRPHRDAELGIGDYEEAASIANRCLARGIAVNDIDLLICAAAVRRGWSVFTTDKDFSRYAQVCELRLHRSMDH
jgi:predicted nucleic acid-binding protein